MPACVLTFKHEVAQVRVCVCTSESLNARTMWAFVCKHEMAQLCVCQSEWVNVRTVCIFVCKHEVARLCVCVPT